MFELWLIHDITDSDADHCSEDCMNPNHFPLWQVIKNTNFLQQANYT
jgi:hypothetical protein